MSIVKKMQQPGFWKNFAKIAIPFFIIFSILMLFINSWRDIFAGDFAKVNETNFAEGQWISFFGMKFAISFFYALWLTFKNTK